MSTPALHGESLGVLIIEDDAVLRVTMQDYLEEVGFEVQEAENGYSGLAAFAELPAEYRSISITSCPRVALSI